MSMSPLPPWLTRPLKRALIAAGYERHMAAHPGLSAAAGLTLLGACGDLRDRGWFRSFASRRPEDAAGAPLPWFTYGAIAFLESRVPRPWRVFEYGCGHSTLWWAERVASVTAVEHVRLWADRIRGRAPANVEILLREPAPDVRAASCPYANAPVSHGGPFEVIVLDGMERVRCIRVCLDALADEGVVVWDNAEREAYEPGFALLAERGFRCVSFDGMGPINPYGWRTSFFYRDDNVLGL